MLGNRFRIVLRDLRPTAVEAIERAAGEVACHGVANYFDDQRFGSVGQSGEFIAQPWCLGDYERALWLALADPNPHDSPAERGPKQVLRDRWGQWSDCRLPAAPSHLQAIVRLLAARPGDFRGALARIRSDWRSLYVAAFQSHLWNRLLARYLRELCRPEQLSPVPLRFGPVPFHHALEPAQSEALKPPNYRCRPRNWRPPPGLIEQLLTEVLGELGLQRRQLRIKYPRDTFFSKGSRPAVFYPQGLRTSREPDELHPGQTKLLLACDLPRGCYATILLKRLSLPLSSSGPIQDSHEPTDEP